MLKDYYALAKPGIVYGNIVLFVGGFALALGQVTAAHASAVPLFVAGLAGLALVIASACVFNNYVDRDIDARMQRTKNRPLAARRIKERNAIAYGTALGIAGFFTLIAWANTITVIVILAGFFFYVFAYSLWSKRRTAHAVFIGAIAGAIPPVAGYTTLIGRLDLGAGILFLVVFLWQLPHFFAISIRRAKDYELAGVPMLTMRFGTKAAKLSMVALIVAFACAASLLAYFRYADLWFGAVAAVLGFAWAAVGIGGLWTRDEERWSRDMFVFSLMVIVALFGAMTLEGAWYH